MNHQARIPEGSADPLGDSPGFEPGRLARQKDADLRLCLLNSVREGIVAMPVVTMALPASMFLTALVTRAYPVSAPTIGLLASLPFLANFLQIFFCPILLRWGPPKTITVISATLHMVTWLALGLLLPWVPHRTALEAGEWIAGWYFVSSVFGAFAGVTWSMWIEEWIPPRIRGKYFGRRNQICQVSTLCFLLLSGWVISMGRYSIHAFQAVILGSVLLRLFSLRWQWTSPTRHFRPPSPSAGSITSQARVVWKAKSFLLFVAFGAVWSFATNIFGPFYTVFMFDHVGFSAWDVGVVTALSQVGGALSLPAWGRLLDRYGNKSVMVVSLILWQLGNILWCFSTDDNRLLLYGLWAWAGSTSAGFVLGQFTIGLRLIPADAKGFAIGFNLAVSSLVAAVAPVLGGACLSSDFFRGWDPVSAYHLCFIVQPVVTLAGAVLLLRVDEPEASALSTVVGAMRNIRTLSAVLGLSFFVNYLFVKNAPPGEDSEA